MLRVLKWIGVSLAALVIVLVGGAAAFLYFVNWNWFKGIADSQGSRAAGRQFAIDGDLRVKLHGRLAEVHAERIRLANADWAKEPNMLEIGALDFRIDLLELLRGRTVLPELTLTRPKLDLEKPDDKRKNWDMAPASPGNVAVKATVPQKRTQVPIIGQLVVSDGELTVTDVPAKLQLTSRINTMVGKSREDERTIQLRSKGTVDREPFTFSAVGGSILSLRDPKKPYPLDVELRAGPTVFSAKGTVTDPVQLAGIDLTLDVKGDSLAHIFPFTAIPLPPTRPYALSGRLQKEQDVWSFAGFKGRVGGSDLAGDLRYDGSAAKPDIKADAVSRKLDFDDLAGLIGAGPAKQEHPEANPDGVIPDVPVNLARLRAANLDMRLRAAQVLAPNLPLQDMDARFVLRDGLLQVQPLKFGIAQGAIDGTVTLDGRKDLPAVSADLNLRRLSLKQFFQNTRFEALSAGRFGGHVKFAGSGRSLAEVLAASDGKTTLSMSGGQVSALMLDAASVDIAKALADLLGDKPTELRCFVADFDARKGLFTSDVFILDTARTNIEGSAKVNFADEAMDLRLVGHPKQPSPAVATTPITIGGTMKHPKVGIDPTGAALRGAAAVALGIVFPSLAILPFIELGTGQDSNCGELIRQAEQHAKEGPERRSSN